MHDSIELSCGRIFEPMKYEYAIERLFFGYIVANKNISSSISSSYTKILFLRLFFKVVGLNYQHMSDIILTNCILENTVFSNI